MAVTYKNSGVDIDAGEKMVDLIKKELKSTFTKNVMNDVGLFGGFYKVPKGFKNPVLVSSVDGVGTKLRVAFLMDKHDTVGEDLVNHCVNDIAVCGAVPMYFLDYFATGKLKPEVGYQVVKGMARGCRNNGCSLIGGETAEMPGFYADGEYDVAGTIVGIVDAKKSIDGSKIKKGDMLVGLPSNGLHTNGYSLARKVLLEKYKVTTKVSELGCTIGEELLKVHRSYLKTIQAIMKKVPVNGISHITGGGIVGNTKRLLSSKLKLEIDWKAWERPAIFKLIQKEGKVPEDDIQRALNLGIGLVFVVSQKNLNKTLNELKKLKEKPVIIGEVK